MGLILIQLLLLLFVTVTICVFNHKVVPACKKQEKVCKFEFDVRYKFSMVYTDDNGYSAPAVIQNRTIMKKILSKNEEIELTQKELEQILTVDGVNKLLFTINREFPGSPIIVYEGQTYKFSMVYNDKKGYAKPIVIRNGTMMKRSAFKIEEFEPLTPKEREQVLTVDGVYKLLFTINGDFPGPPIVVYEGQAVEVLVRNRLSNEVFTIHWHGMHQKHTPWMDGASMVSQCPIGPGQSFLYRFKAEPAGTHWYHSHQGSMRGDGLAGPLIVLPRKERTDLPRVEDDFIILIQEWNRNKSSLENHEIHALNMHVYADDFNCTASCYTVTHTTDGTSMGMEPFHSGLINGKGHHYPDKTEKPLAPVLPLEIFKVKPNKNYRFRIINAATFVSFRFSIDEHLLRVIATDGHNVEQETAQSVVIASGERYDVLVQTKRKSKKNFFIRAENMELKTQYLDPIYPGVVKAVMRYKDAPETLPDSSRQTCTRENACKVINCPNKLYPEADHVDCFSVADLRSTQETISSYPVPVSEKGGRIREDFLNFHFTTANPESENHVFKATINGHVFTTPTCPPQSTYGPEASSCIYDCKKQNCIKQQCNCTHFLNYDDTSLGSAVQLILLSRDGLRGATDHPIHIHGHSFHVLKMVYPELNLTSGLVSNFSRDIECEMETCLNPKWSKQEWEGGNLPGLNLQNPPLKDTVVVPRGGYVVLRFYLDNPGYWFLHCHMDAHQMEGMALIIKEGQQSFHPKPPKGFPSCGDFTWTLDEYQEITNGRIASLGSGRDSTDSYNPQKSTNTDFQWDLTIAVFITCLFGAVLFLLCLIKYYIGKCIVEKRHQGSPYSLLSQNRTKPLSYGSS